MKNSGTLGVIKQLLILPSFTAAEAKELGVTLSVSGFQ